MKKVNVTRVIDTLFGFKNPYSKETYDDIINVANKNINKDYIWLFYWCCPYLCGN